MRNTCQLEKPFRTEDDFVNLNYIKPESQKIHERPANLHFLYPNPIPPLHHEISHLEIVTFKSSRILIAQGKNKLSMSLKLIFMGNSVLITPLILAIIRIPRWCNIQVFWRHIEIWFIFSWRKNYFRKRLLWQEIWLHRLTNGSPLDSDFSVLCFH